MLFAFTLPMSQRISVICLGVLVVVALVQVRKVYAKPYATFVAMVVLFAMYALGLLHKDYPLESHHPAALEQKLSLLVFPLLALLFRPMKAHIRLAVFQMFTLGVIVFSLFSLGLGLVRMLETGSWAEITYAALANGFHPSYASAYALTGVAVLLTDAWFSRKTPSLMRLLAVGWLLIYICLLASRAGMLCALGLLTALLSVRIFRVRKMDGTTVQGLVGIALVAVLPLVLPGTSSRVVEMRMGIQEPLTDAEETGLPPQARSSTQVRFLAWQCSWELLRENPLGVGTDDVTPELMEKYQQRQQEYAYEKKLNAHNQFFETAVELGWPGLISLLAILVLALKEALVRRDMLLQCFLFIVGFNMLFESFLELQAGIVFFGFGMFVLLNRSGTKRGGQSSAVTA